MPSLKDLHCFIELSGSHQKLQEFGATYGDGLVDAFVAIPGESQPFAIRLTSSNFIAPGLAMYVFIDGVYQCNRNRQDIKLRKPPDRRSLVDFCVRQKEEKQKDGSMIARDWKFEKFNIASAKDGTDTSSSNITDNIGCIEVIVLRCAGSRSAKSASSSKKTGDNAKPKTMNMDGACDAPGNTFGLDGVTEEWTRYSYGPRYDDRGWQQLRSTGQSAAGPGAPAQSLASGFGPPAPVSPRSYNAKSLHGQGRSGYGSQYGVPPPGYSYGSGPVPHQPPSTSVPAPPPAAVAPNPPGIDPRQLDQLLTQAVKKGVAAYQRKESTSQVRGESGAGTAEAQQPPGAWPLSPFGPIATPQQGEPSHVRAAAPSGNFSIAPIAPGATWGHQSTIARTKDNGGWTQPAKSAAPSRVSRANGWSSSGSHANSWNADNTWGDAPDKNGRTSSENRRQRSKNASALGGSAHTTKQHALANGGSGTEKSRPRSLVWESKEDKDGWTHIDAASETNSSWASTVRPQSSISALAPTTAVSFKTAKTRSEVPELTHSRNAFTAVSAPSWGAADSEHKQINRVGTAVNAPAPYGITFEEFLRKSAKGQEGSVTWSMESIEGYQASWGDHAKGSWDEGNLSSQMRDWAGKEIATLEDGWGTTDDAWTQKDEAKGDSTAKHNSTSNPWATTEKASIQSKHAKGSSSKSRDTKSHQLSSSPADTTSKSHWQFPPPSSNKKLDPILEAHGTLPEESLYTVSKDTAKEKGVEHQVRAGKGMKYGHSISRPEYIDSLDKPYAVFRFKYRSRAILKQMFGDAVVPDTETPVGTAGTAGINTTSINTAATKESLKHLPQDALIESLLKLQNALRGNNEQKAKSPKTENVGRDRTTDWVERHSREASEMGKAQTERRSRSRSEKKKGGEKKRKEEGEKTGWEASWGKDEEKKSGDGSGWGGNGWT